MPVLAEEGNVGNLGELTATEQVAAIRRREVSPVELTEHYLERIHRHDKTLGTFITLTEDLALEGAKAAADRVAHEDPDDLPPLIGLPLGIKDMHPTAGVVTTLGSAALHDFVPPADAWTVGLLRQAGICLLGKTNTPEFGPTCYTVNDVAPPAVTPWDLDRSASGSSGGAAAAVAAGLMPVGHGSDGLGSTRTPAAACGLVGVKPSRGVLSTFPNTAFMQLGTEGPLARTVADAALLLDVMAVHPAGELWPNPLGAGHPSFREMAATPTGRKLRIASYTDTGIEGNDPHPDGVAAVAATTALLEQLGHEVIPIEHPAPLDESAIQAIKARIGAGLALSVPAMIPEDRRHLLRPLSRRYVEKGSELSATELMMADFWLTAITSRFLIALDGYDAMLTPTANGPAVPLGYYGQEDTDDSQRKMLGWSCYTPHANFSGACALSLPLHWSDEGLPVGSQLMAAPGRDALLMGLATELEALAPWIDRKPPIWSE